MTGESLRSTFTKSGWCKRRVMRVIIPRGGGGFTVLKTCMQGGGQRLLPTLLSMIKRYFIHLIFDPAWTSYWYFLVSDGGRISWNNQIISDLRKNTSKKYQFLQHFTAFDSIWQRFTAFDTFLQHFTAFYSSLTATEGQICTWGKEPGRDGKGALLINLQSWNSPI